MNGYRIGRRQWLKRAGIAAAGSLALGAVQSSTFAEVSPASVPTVGTRKRLLRVAHLTDIHVQPELKAGEGLAACLRHVQSQADKPDLIINSGDCIMDSMKKDRSRTELQWDLWHKIWKDECSIAVEHGIGNHDIWGWNKNKSQTNGNEAKWGKLWALDALGLPKSYRSFDRGGWHFIALDSIQPDGAAYTAGLDDEQFAWLESDLAKTDPKTPVFVMSHIPIFSITPFFELKADQAGGDAIQIAKPSMHADYRRIKDLFKRHSNVKVAVSGHIHLVDRVDYAGVSYFCDGAVSGNWWKGSRFNECEPGYSMMDLYDDGTVERTYVSYGWIAAGN